MGPCFRRDDTEFVAQPLSHFVWTILVWSGLLFTARHDPAAVRRIQAQGAYGLLSPRLRDWLLS